ncbi:germination protein, Ger(x)C family [Lihuaxuella thermophila]|uniref:Germination protein, Ger(X)C family n=1 Tax=Lihuaxuella thermophila TaxID=1173111 RepID=A0A1H8HG44_9BACL|nr:germination protein, Ger(x)C family [Lihuaxuella thermophila]
MGYTPRNTRDQLGKQISGRVRTYKNRILLFGEALAKKNIYPYLDVFYRDPRASLNARIAVVQGKAEDILHLGKVGNTLIGQHLDELIESAENLTMVPRENVQLICPVMLDPGQDFALPYLKLSPDKNGVAIVGTAMFHGSRMTGSLNVDESRLFLLMMNGIGQEARMTKMIHPGERSPGGYITIDVLRRTKRDMKVKINPDGEVDVWVDVSLQAEVEEYPRDQLNEPNMLDKLGKQLSAILTDDARKLIAKMQRARFDGFGVGRELIAFHPEVWKKKNWDRDYPKVRFHPQVEVELVRSGIIN